MWSKSSYTVCIAKVWFMCDSPAFFCVCVAKDGGWSDGWNTEVGIVHVRWAGWENRGFGDCVMHTIHLPCHAFDLFCWSLTSVPWFPGGGAHSGQPTYTNFYDFLFYDAAAGYLGVVRKETPSPSTLTKAFSRRQALREKQTGPNIPPLNSLLRNTSPREPWRNYFHGFKWILYILAPVSLVPTTSRRSPLQV